MQQCSRSNNHCYHRRSVGPREKVSSRSHPRRTKDNATQLKPAEESALRQELAYRIQREKGLFRPFLSANDRSRWLTIRSLAERGTFAIEDLAAEPGWDTIDAVVHPDKNGELHLYSSKPPLLSILLAGPYWLLVQATGWTLGDHPFLLGRFMLVLYGLVPLGIIILASCSCIELIGTTDRGKIWSSATIAFGTLLTTFAVALTNHSFAAACTAISLYCVLVVTKKEGRSWLLFAAAGLTAGLAAAFDLPALAWTTAVVGILVLYDLRQTILATIPAVLVVFMAALGSNLLAHNTVWPPYAFREAPTYTERLTRSDEPQVSANQWNPENWYDYRFRMPNGRVIESYWRSPNGIDRGEASIARYAFRNYWTPRYIFTNAYLVARTSWPRSYASKAWTWMATFIFYIHYCFHDCYCILFDSTAVGPQLRRIHQWVPLGILVSTHLDIFTDTGSRSFSHQQGRIFSLIDTTRAFCTVGRSTYVEPMDASPALRVV